VKSTRIDRPEASPLFGIGGALLAGLVAWLIGVTWYQSTLVSAVVLSISGGYYLLPTARETRWPPYFYERGRRSRRDVSRLSWALKGSSGSIPVSGIVQLESLAEKRLALRGVRFEDAPNASALLGDRVYALLSSKPSTLPHAVFATAVDAVGALDDVPLAPHMGVRVPEGWREP
jgi:hypothetical protein